ncbi:hypothetical protein GO730_33140 [Spirosoma sp. HMF3257]|uniref:Uncharacterized protein n=1 Tax=Spirosoma telluris TaxID=2183553 RepID=A0A327NSQ8_9BACT|nr:hypothetical protein [Spirosoma telluris]RAI77765.1 hypothetical protein HMF3257_33045 [Spirosoma telluris]
MEFVVNQFFIKDPLSKNGDNIWTINDWRGFFMHLYKERTKLYDPTDNDGANWNYIANPSGGFFGFWWYFRTIQKDIYTPYLQLENNELCFKIEVKDETKRYEAREEAYRKLIETANELGITSIKRPGRMGNGRYMTVLRWDGDYLESANGKLDFNATLENLKKAQLILDTAFSH